MSATTRPDKLSIVVYSGEFDKVHYALVMATAAAAIGTPATLFFTMDACRALEKPDEDGAPAWRAMPVSQGVNAGLAQGGAMDDDFQKKGIATFEELLTSCPALGVKIMVCEMGLRARGMTRASLRQDIPIEPGGVVTFLNDASKSGAVVFV